MPIPERYTSEEFGELCDVHNERITELGIHAAKNFGALEEDLPDAVQDALLDVHRKVIAGQLEKRNYDTLGNNILIVIEGQTIYFPRSYFKKTVENHVLDRHRARKRRQRSIGHAVPLEPGESALISDIDARHLTVAELSARLNRLCPICKTLIKLRFYDNLSYQQICDELAPLFKNEAAVRRKLSDCLDQLGK